MSFYMRVFYIVALYLAWPLNGMWGKDTDTEAKAQWIARILGCVPTIDSSSTDSSIENFKNKGAKVFSDRLIQMFKALSLKTEVTVLSASPPQSVTIPAPLKTVKEEKEDPVWWNSRDSVLEDEEKTIFLNVHLGIAQELIKKFLSTYKIPNAYKAYISYTSYGQIATYLIFKGKERLDRERPLVLGTFSVRYTKKGPLESHFFYDTDLYKMLDIPQTKKAALS